MRLGRETWVVRQLSRQWKRARTKVCILQRLILCLDRTAVVGVGQGAGHKERVLVRESCGISFIEQVPSPSWAWWVPRAASQNQAGKNDGETTNERESSELGTNSVTGLVYTLFAPPYEG